MDFTLLPGSLTWEEADPSRHPFDAASALDVIRNLPTDAPLPRRPPGTYLPGWGHGEGSAWAEAMSRGLADRYGRWAVGWRWSQGEGDLDGGPVGSWCCTSHSIAADPTETLARVAAALVEWRGWLEDLADRFDRYPLVGDSDQEVMWERGAVHLIHHVVDRTGAESGWYGHCHLVLTWYLSRWGIPSVHAERLVDEAIGGRFESWVGPDEVLVTEVAERIAHAVGASAAEDPDHLLAWLEAREGTQWHVLEGDDGPVVGRIDGIAERIATIEHERDPERARCLRAAYEQMRADADAGRDLGFALLASWQRSVLDVPQTPFRSAPAFAKRGRERYRFAAGDFKRFAMCVAEARDESVPVAARAARVYLDVCFFHPFEDGNARSALLAAAFVLARAGIVLDEVGPLVQVRRLADGPEGAAALADLITVLIESTRRRAAADPDC